MIDDRADEDPAFRLGSLTQPLLADVGECRAMRRKSDSQFWRRMVVRSTFAYCEAFLHELAGITLASLFAKAPPSWDDHEKFAKFFLLVEQRPRASVQGRIDYEDVHTPFLNHCAFVLRTASEIFGVDPTPFFSNNGWNQMQKALKVRHPNHPSQRGQGARYR